MHVTTLQPKRHVVEREHAREGLAHIRNLKQVFGAGNGAALPDDFSRRRTNGRHGALSHSDFGVAFPEGCADPPLATARRRWEGGASPGALVSPETTSETKRDSGISVFLHELIDIGRRHQLEGDIDLLLHRLSR